MRQFRSGAVSSAIKAAAVLGAAGLALAACGGSSTSSESEAASSAAPASSAAAASSAPAEGGGDAGGAATDLKVGIVMPLTGDLGSYGPSLSKAIELGASLVNDAAKTAGVPATCTIVATEDDQTQAAAGVEAANKVVKSNGANIVIGSMSSGVTAAVAESVTIPSNVIMISPTSSDPSITDLADNDTVFRVYPSDTLQATALVQALAKEFGSDATVNIGARNDAFGTALLAKFKQGWEAQGGKVGTEVSWNPDAANFDSEAQKLVSGDPAAWVIADFPTTFAKFGPALVRTGKWDPKKTFMTEALSSQGAIDEVGAKIMEGVRGTAATSDGAEPDAFSAAFKAAYPDVEFTGFEGTGFDSGVLACLSAISAGSTDTAALIPALRKVSGPEGTQYTWQQLDKAVADAAAGKPVAYKGAWAQVDFDAAGDPGAGVFNIWTVKDGKPANIDKVSFSG